VVSHGDRPIGAGLVETDGGVTVTLAEPATIRAGETLEVVLTA
jgi:hypothetical protein